MVNLLYESLICVFLSIFGVISTRFKFLGLGIYILVAIISSILVLTRYFLSSEEGKIRLLALPSTFILLCISFLLSPKSFLISFAALYFSSLEIFSPFELGRKIPFLTKPVIFVIFYFLGFYSVANPFSFATYDALYYALLISIFGFFLVLSQKHFIFAFPAVLIFPIFHSSLPCFVLSLFAAFTLFKMRHTYKNHYSFIFFLFIAIFVLVYFYDSKNMLPAGAREIF